MLKQYAKVLIYLSIGIFMWADMPCMGTHGLHNEARAMVDKAVTFFKAKSLSAACASFKADAAWQHGTLSLFVISAGGACLFDNGYIVNIWENITSFTDVYDEPLLETMLEKGHHGGQVIFGWEGGIRHAYVKTVEKEGKTYIIGSGYFYRSAEDFAKIIVKRIEHDWPIVGTEKIFERVSNPVGFFVSGSVYGFIIDEKNICVAHGGNIVWVGQDMEGLKDREERVMIEEVRKRIGVSGKPVWHEYMDNNLVRRVYCKQYTDQRTQHTYLIFAGYFPTVDEDLIKHHAHSIADSIKKEGLDTFFEKYAQDRLSFSRDCCPGPLTLLITDMKGEVHVRSVQLANIGTVLDDRLEKSRPVSTVMLEVIEKFGKGWATQERNSSYEHLYGEKVETKDGDFIVTIGGYFPRSKQDRAQIMVHDAAFYMSSHTIAQTCRYIKQNRHFYVQGNMGIFIYDDQGYCWLDMVHPRLAWTRDEALGTLPDGFVQDERGLFERTIFSASVKKKVRAQEHRFVIGVGFYPEGSA